MWPEPNRALVASTALGLARKGIGGASDDLQAAVGHAPELDLVVVGLGGIGLAEGVETVQGCQGFVLIVVGFSADVGEQQGCVLVVFEN